MTIAIFGATGQTGSRLLKMLLQNGHHVKALARDEKKLQNVQNSLLQVLKGDVLNASDVNACVKDCEAVYVLLGTYGNKVTTIYSAGTANVIAAMKKYGIKRVICLSSAGVLRYDGGFFGRVIVPLTLWRPFKDKRKQLELLAASDLDWTIVRPTEIKDRAAGILEIGYHKMGKASIALSTLVSFLYQQLFYPSEIRKMPIIGD